MIPLTNLSQPDEFLGGFPVSHCGMGHQGMRLRTAAPPCGRAICATERQVSVSLPSWLLSAPTDRSFENSALIQPSQYGEVHT